MILHVITWFCVIVNFVEEEVEKMVNNFSKRFNEMTHDTLEELEKRGVNPKKVIFLLKMPNAYLQKRNEHMKFLDTLKKAADIFELFDTLNEYWDHFNYHLLERLIKAPRIEKYIDLERCSQLQKDMDQYIQEMCEFRQKATIGAYCKVFVKKKEDVPKDFQELVRNKDKWSEMNTLQDVENFRQDVAEEYQLHTCLVFFKHILLGSVIITWWIPIVTPLPPMGPQPHGSCTAEEHMNTEGG